MNIPKLAIENHQFTMVLVILLVLFGTVSFFTMPRTEDPQVSPAGSSVIVIYPGANPSDVEELIIEPLEEVINELDDIKDIKSTARDGLGVIGVEFLSGSDPDDKYSDVVQKVNSVSSKLPADILSLDIEKWSITDVNIMQLALLSDSVSYRTLESEAERLKKELERSAGVKRVKLWAYPEQEVRLSLNLEKMAQKKIGLSRLIQSLQSSNQNIPGGNLDVGARRFNIQTSGSYSDLEQIRNTIVHSANGQIVFLKNIADVDFAYEDKNYFAKYKDKRALLVTVTQKQNTNIFDVTDALKEKITAFEPTLADNIELATIFDQSKSVESRMNGFFLNLLQGLILVGLVVILAVGLRASTIVILVIPISILIGIGLVDLTGFGIQQMTIAGLVIALGLLVDNAIVVTENISRFMKKGHDPQDAAVTGTSQIAWAIVSSTATTILAFVPMMLMGNVTGDFIRSMPVTVVYTLTASLLISLILTPYLARKFLNKEVSLKESPLRRLLNREIEHRYRKTLGFALQHPRIVIIISVVIFIFSLALFPLVGVSFFPKGEKPQFIINIDTPDGTTLDRTEQVTAYVDSVLKDYDQIKHYVINIGQGNPRIYYNIVPKRVSATHAQFFIELRQYEPDSFKELIKDLRAKLGTYPGAKIEVKEFEQGPPIEAPIAIRLLGKNLEVLKELSKDVEKMIQQQPGTINIKNPLATSKTDLHVNINRDKAGLFGVPIVEIDRTVRASVAGLTVSQFRDLDGKEYNMVVRLPFEEKISMDELQNIYVASVTGEQIPLRQLARLELKASPMLINHYNLERNVTLTADVTSDISVDQAASGIVEKLRKYSWPHGYRYAIAGELETREESFGGMMQAIVVSLIGILGVLVLQFRSYTQPLIVFSAIPLAIIGSIIALLITGYSFSFTAFVGLTSLIGIVINNSIILVDYTNQLRRKGQAILDALKEAGETRFIPIVLTTATTVGGLLPLTLGGGSLWAPMGWTIIGGLLMSTFLTLIVVPVLYLLYTPAAK